MQNNREDNTNESKSLELKKSKNRKKLKRKRIKETENISPIWIHSKLQQKVIDSEEDLDRSTSNEILSIERRPFSVIQSTGICNFLL